MEIPETLKNRRVLIFVSLLVLLGITWRLVPHLPNFAPIGAIALVTGMILGWRQSVLAVVVVMAVSDLVIGSYSSMPWTWLGLGLIGGVGVLARKLPSLWRAPVGALGASSLFFIVSNFGTWLASGMYSHDLAGLVQCYVMALPFFRATLLSDLVFGMLLMAVYAVFIGYRPRYPIADIMWVKV